MNGCPCAAEKVRAEKKTMKKGGRGWEKIGKEWWRKFNLCLVLVNPLIILLSYWLFLCFLPILHPNAPSSLKHCLVGGGERLWWKPQHHQDLPGVQCIWAKPKQLAAHHIHWPAARTTHLRGDPLHSTGLCFHTKCPGLLQRDVQSLLPGDWQDCVREHQRGGVLGQCPIFKGNLKQSQSFQNKKCEKNWSRLYFSFH